jgi:hypothetical protein
MVTPHTLASDEAAAKQLAEAFNESLEFLILLNEVIPGGDPLALPEWCLLLGTTYTTNDVMRTVLDSICAETSIGSSGQKSLGNGLAFS